MWWEGTIPVVAEEVNVMGVPNVRILGTMGAFWAVFVPNVRILGTMGTLDEEQGA